MPTMTEHVPESCISTKEEERLAMAKLMLELCTLGERRRTSMVEFMPEAKRRYAHIMQLDKKKPRHDRTRRSA